MDQGLVNDLENAVVARVNATFASASALTSDARGGVAADATPIPSTGATVPQISADIGTMIDVITDAGISLSGCSWVASERGAAYLRTMRLTDNAGTLAGHGIAAAPPRRWLAELDSGRRDTSEKLWTLIAFTQWAARRGPALRAAA